MSIEKWSETIILAQLQNDPSFTDDMQEVIDLIEGDEKFDVVLNLADVEYLNSSNIGKLLKVRKTAVGNNRNSLVLCGVSREVWSVFLTTGLDKVFEFSDNVGLALAGLQVDQGDD